jgi:predicted protein tyrosine phosphatase
MPTIHVCPWVEVPHVAARIRPARLITLLDPTDVAETPPEVHPDLHLRVGVNDISEPLMGMTAPDERHVAQLVAFLKEWDAAAPLLVHCYAGISRSTATAFIAMSLLNEGREAEAARKIRETADHAQPNRRIVALADDLLGRGGRMVDAVAAMGPARPTYLGHHITLPARLG